MQGLLGIFVPNVNEKLAVLGPGDLVGEMSLLEARPPTESVIALEATKILALPHSAVRSKGEEDPSFSARLHFALACLLSQRLRRANRQLAVQTDTDTVNRTGNPEWKRLAMAMQEFKELLHEANQTALKNEDLVPEEAATRVVDRFLTFLPLMNEVHDAAEGDDRLVEEIGLRSQYEFLPYLLLTETAERFYSKPRGYAGDYWSIELMYRNQPSGTSRIGALVDRCFLTAPACAAVRNRRGLLAEEIASTIADRTESPAQISSLACGPASEVFDVFETVNDRSQAKFNLLDIDLQALAFVAERRDKSRLGRSISLISENLINLILGRSEAPVAKQDLIYSIGLIDYFNDKLVVKLLNLIHGMLDEGGRVILGNFHPRNSAREFSNHVLDWKLIHRTEDDMNRLFAASYFGRPCTNIRFEAEGINLFAECMKQ